MFGFNPRNKEGENQRKKIFFFTDTLRIDTSMISVGILDSMPCYDNEFLKTLDLTEPVDKKSIEDKRIKNPPKTTELY